MSKKTLYSAMISSEYKDLFCTYYLSDSSCNTSRYLVFEASFTESCKIAKCYIIASSLNQASLILYDQLSEVYGEDYLDAHLLCLKFMTTLSSNSFGNE